MKYRCYAAVALIAAVSAFGSIAAHAGDITGAWSMKVQTSLGSGTPSFILTQQGDKVTGTYKGQLGEAPVSGTVAGNEVHLTFKASGGGQEMQVEYTGMLEGDAMSGKVKLGEFGEGTFRGNKQ